MNEEKLSSDKVPIKFSEWLLTMGCPSEKVPTVDKLSEMCRGQYYMVWRSLMEHVEPKASVKLKRMQVFNNDVQRCQKRNAFCKPDSSVVIPKELSLWNQQAELKARLEAVEARVGTAKQELSQLVEKVSSKLSHRNLARDKTENSRRRAWLLQQIAEELRNKKDNLLETKSIAESLCCVEDSGDIESKLDKCTSTQRPSPKAQINSSMATPILNSNTSTAEYNESEEYISLVKCSGEALWPQLCERRAALIARLNVASATDNTPDQKKVTPQWVLSHTASLHTTLGLEALKNRAHVKQMRKRLAEALTELNDCISGDSCELLVCRSEQARVGARVDTLRSLVDDVTTCRGNFTVVMDGNVANNCAKQISVIDKSINNKREELRRVITSLAITERKTQNVRDCLITVFNSFHTDGHWDRSVDRFGHLSMPQEPISTLRRFYEEQREKSRNKVELSMEFDTEDNCSYQEDNPNPKFIDELKVYLKKFNLENNRKLVLDSGDKVWIFETLVSSIGRLHTRLQDNNLSCPIVCPSVSLQQNLEILKRYVQKRNEMRGVLKELECRKKGDLNIDISSHIEEEQKTTDNIKKRLNDNLISLQKSMKTLDLGQENLRLWSENQMRKYMSNKRAIDGRTYNDYESYYVEYLDINN